MEAEKNLLENIFSNKNFSLLANNINSLESI